MIRTIDPFTSQMPLLSSPVAYPPSSSPPTITTNRKRTLEDASSKHPKRKSFGPFRAHAINSPTRPSTVLTCEQPSGDVTVGVAECRSKGPFLDEDEEREHDANEKSASMQSTLHVANEVDWEIEDAPEMRYASLGVHEKSGRGPHARTSSGKTVNMQIKDQQKPISYERLIAGRSATVPGKATKSFYGIEIHALVEQAAQEAMLERKKTIACGNNNHEARSSTNLSTSNKTPQKRKTMLWTEKYRARKYTDLVGDERTHRDVLRWLKHWDPIVFPSSARPKTKIRNVDPTVEAKPHRKILLLAGPPGLGKTTLSHVCARQAGYEIVEINASDERSRDVVKGRIRECLGSENVKGINIETENGNVRKAGRPVCVVVDEVDGVVSGTSGGEGGFIKALIDLVNLDQKNSNVLESCSGNVQRSKKKKGDRFRLLRPMILICNDVYHPALRPLRASTVAEVIHIRRPPLESVVSRLITVFQKEGLPCEGDGVRRLCEATWGVSNQRESRSQSDAVGEGDMRGILVVGEWAAAKLRSSPTKNAKLTRSWVDENMVESLSYGGDGSRGLGHGGAKEAVERVFLDGAGFAKSAFSISAQGLATFDDGNSPCVSEHAKRGAIGRLREIIDTSGERDRIATDCFLAYPSRPFHDDTFLSKPVAAYDWLHFHDRLSLKVHVGQDWELGSYLSQSALAFHYLFAAPKQQWITDFKQRDDDPEDEPLPLTGPRADYLALEALKQNKAALIGLQSSLSIDLIRAFRSAEEISTDFLPHLLKILTPNVKPVVVGGSGEQSGIVSVRKEGERQMIQRAVCAMGAVGVTFERMRIESGRAGARDEIYRMEP